MIVEVLPKEELKSAGGLVLSADTHGHRSSTDENRAELAMVLANGPGYVDDDGNDVPIDIPPGSVVLLSRIGLKLYSQFPGLAEYTSETIALTRDSEIHCAWPSIDAFQTYAAKLNS